MKLYFNTQYNDGLFETAYPLLNRSKLEEKYIAFYLRISDKKRGDELDTSPKNQLDLLVNYYKNKSYTLPVIVYLDFDKSAKEVKYRKEFLQMFNDSDYLDLVLFKNWDRLFRNAEEQMRYLRLFKEKKINLTATHDSNDPLARDMVAIFNQECIRKQQKSIKDIHQLRLDKSIPVVSHPFGYKRKLDVGMTNKVGKRVLEKDWFVDTKKANVVKSVFSDYLNKVSVSDIKEKNNFNNILFVYRILKNKTYCGYFKYAGEWYKSPYVPVIIDEKVFSSVQKKLN